MYIKISCLPTIVIGLHTPVGAQWVCGCGLEKQMDALYSVPLLATRKLLLGLGWLSESDNSDLSSAGWGLGTLSPVHLSDCGRRPPSTPDGHQNQIS